MFRKLLTLAEARGRLHETLPSTPLGREPVRLREAVGRVLAEDVASPINVPPFTRSTVDGFAVQAEDTFGAEETQPVVLRLVGQVDVGEMSRRPVAKGATVEIVTGAPLPMDADAVVMVEHTALERDSVLVYRSVAQAENTMAAGSDIGKDEAVLKRGTVLSPSQVGVLAALGLSRAVVFKRPRVAIVSTGAEIVEPGKPLPEGKIYDINTYSLTAAVRQSGGQPVDFGIVQDDDVDALKAVVKKALSTADVVITSGGVSVGPKDVVPLVLDQLGTPGLVVHGVAIKPGKPVAVAVVGSTPVFALPGNPTSSLLGFHLLVRPYLFQITGRKAEAASVMRALTATKLFAARGRRTFVMVTLSRTSEGEWLASPVSTGQSGAITTLAKADGFVELTEHQQFVDAGTEVTVTLLKAARC